MKKKFTEIKFENTNRETSHFDIVKYEDILKFKPTDHNQFDFHKLSFYALFLCTQNDGKYNVNFKEYKFKKGTLFTLRKDNIHKFYETKGKGLLLIFTEDFIVHHTNKIEASKTFLLFNEMLTSPKLQLNDADYLEVMNIVKLIKKEYFEVSDDYSLNILRNYIQVIITKLFRIKSNNNDVFADNKYLSMFLQLQDLVEKECFNNKKVSFYAKEMGVSSKTLNNVTQAILHKTTKTFINDLVIIQAKRLISNSQNSLTEIAYQMGFEDPTNFFKYFRKYTGESPSQFRDSCQGS